METELVYQPVRAMIRTINPRETKLLEVEQKFQRKVRRHNVTGYYELCHSRHPSHAETNARPSFKQVVLPYMYTVNVCVEVVLL